MRIPRTESKTVEFKQAFNQDAIVALVSFANAAGGDVYVGVRDDGKVVGVSLADDSETSWVNEVKSKTAPAIVPEADRIVAGGKTVVRLHIAPLPVKPTSVQGRYYVRKGKANHLMSLGELSDLYLKASGGSWDAMSSRRDLENISLEKVATFARRMNPDNPDDPLRVLRKLSLVQDSKPTNACYLAFASDYCQETAFQTGRFKTQAHIIDDRTFNEDLFGELDGVMAFVKNHLMAEIVITGKPAHDIRYDYPVDAIREIVLNMLVHRDYCGVGVNTIKIFDDRMEFTNPGGLPHGLTVNDLLSDAYVTSPRNPQLASLFKTAGLIERYGSGIRRIMDACRDHGGVEVVFEDHDNWFKVVLQKTGNAVGRPDRNPTGTRPEPDRDPTRTRPEPDRNPTGTRPEILGSMPVSVGRVFDALSANGELTFRELAASLGINKDTVNAAVASLVKRNLLRRVGPRKGGHWEIVGS